jgi:ABC-type dipeptide/oligopeptide/nickel transport system ATPase component
MNIPPQRNPQFQKIIHEKIQNFTNCESILTSIDRFFHKHNRGYLTIIGSPGSGKSAILAQFVSSNPHPNFKIIYYNAQIENKNTADEFLKYVCTELIGLREKGEREKEEIPDDVTEGSWFLSLLLRQISDELQPHQKLIIAIDALDTINPNNQPLGTNLLYLPRYLPQGIYFLLTRRPFKPEKSGLLIEAPSQTIDLSQHNLKNWSNESTFIQNWQKIQNQGLSDTDIKILQILTTARNQGISTTDILQRFHHTNTQMLDVNIFDVEEIIDNCFEFLQKHQVDNKIGYSFYHPKFCDWLAERLSYKPPQTPQ